MAATTPGPSGKAEFPPLLPSGFGSKTMGELRQMCVDPFPLSRTRGQIMGGLAFVGQELSTDNVEGELWVDGSFLTEKIDPVDVDLVLCVQEPFYAAATSEQKAKIDWLNTDLRASHYCHSFVFFEYPVGHSLYACGRQERDYWRKQWGFSRSNDPKGIAVVTLP